MSKSNDRLIEAVYRNAHSIGSRPALALQVNLSGSRRPDSVTWAELAPWVTKLADLLHANRFDETPLIHGVYNTPDDVLIALACQRAGIVEVPVDSTGGENYLKSCRNRIDGQWISDDTKRELVTRAWAEIGPAKSLAAHTAQKETSANDDALILFTSGTSGDPKGVVLSHRSLLRNAKAKLIAVPQSTADRRLTVLSIAHAYARTCDLGTWLLSGCTLAITPGFDGWTEHRNRFAPTLCNMVPSLASRVLESDSVPGALRLLGCGGAAMSVDQFGHWIDRGITVIQGYGLTESGPVISSQTPADSVAGHVGCFVAGWQYRIDDERLFVRGDHLMTGYWDDPKSTDQRIDSEGWLDTGDLVRISDSSGQLEILGRCDDRIILSNGHNLDPSAMERRILSVPGIQTAVVTKHPQGRSVELWIELDPSVTSAPNLDQVLRSLPRWERPCCIRQFAIPHEIRDHVFNRKDAVRRGPMLRFLAELQSKR